MKFLSGIKLLLPLIALAFASCKSNDTVADNPYQNNPYYGPNAGATIGGDVGTATPAPTSNYPTYNDSSYTPPAPAPSNSYGGGGGGSYTVVRGDTLYGISRRNGTSVSAIKSANGLGGDTIQPGQVLRIP